LQYREQTYSYYVIPASAGPATLPNFVFRMTPPPEVLKQPFMTSEALFGVSSSVTPAFQPFCVIHEIMEFLELGLLNSFR